ncbi:hypothetical protein UFOVP319_17 [uncultured Caudovirales phage]|uniref:Uncharacterized protein n=1 Tax=uncultured Caudovirales phage TaxID=2100421 RepID=A0A6J5LRZ6_9CAUD|nr:hypothetical protein UFOVP319_17 [uncultured Caudovirales phage]
MANPVFQTRAELASWAKQRLRYPDPAPDAKLRALEDIRRVTLAHVHLPVAPNA